MGCVLLLAPQESRYASQVCEHTHECIDMRSSVRHRRCRTRRAGPATTSISVMPQAPGGAEQRGETRWTGKALPGTALSSFPSDSHQREARVEGCSQALIIEAAVGGGGGDRKSAPNCHALQNTKRSAVNGQAMVRRRRAWRSHGHTDKGDTSPEGRGERHVCQLCCCNASSATGREAEFPGRAVPRVKLARTRTSSPQAHRAIVCFMGVACSRSCWVVARCVSLVASAAAVNPPFRGQERAERARGVRRFNRTRCAHSSARVQCVE